MESSGKWGERTPKAGTDFPQSGGRGEAQFVPEEVRL